MRISAGATRTVILTKRYAFKFPRFYRQNREFEWSRVLMGMLANLQERYWAGLNLPQLCPVVFADPLGLVVVMPRCNPIQRQFGNSAIVCPVEFVWWERYGSDGCRVPVENTAANFGYHNGQLVAFDYGS